MPLLFLLSGMLVHRSLQRGVYQYLGGKVRRILYPYLVWSIVMIALFQIFGWTPVPRLADIIFRPIEHMWFLAYLFAYYVIALSTRWVSAWIVALAFLTLSSTAGASSEWVVFFARGTLFFVGVAFGAHFSALVDAMKNLRAGVGLAIVGLMAVTANQMGLIAMPIDGWLAPVVIALTLGLGAAVRPFDGSTILRPIEYVGRNSIVLYVMHWPLIIFPVRALSEAGALSPMATLLVAIVIATAVPLAVTWATTRVPGMQWLFEWPVARRRASVA